ncbi:MAG: hypothetical protein FJW34_15250 [Acidobacteria bacterium]|nr:hypothetical protein [Acidobacteriota bacterium]
MLLEPGQAIQVNPQPECPTCESWAWDPPAAHIVRNAQGLGWTSRTIFHSPCAEGLCAEYGEPGYFSIAESRTNGYFGFRISRENASHLGWVQLVFPGPVIRPDGFFTYVRWQAHALHPDPNTEIAASEEPRPRLRVELLAKQARLYWNTAFTGYSLEQTPRLDSPAWIPVPGVGANSVTLDLAEAKGFFRLRR